MSLTNANVPGVVPRGLRVIACVKTGSTAPLVASNLHTPVLNAPPARLAVVAPTYTLLPDTTTAILVGEDMKGALIGGVKAVSTAPVAGSSLSRGLTATPRYSEKFPPTKSAFCVAA